MRGRATPLQLHCSHLLPLQRLGGGPVTTATKFQASSPALPCPICGRNDKGGDCRISEALVLCHHGSTFSPPALKPSQTTIGGDGQKWAYTKEADDGRTAVFTLHKPLRGTGRSVATSRVSSKPSQQIKLALLPAGAETAMATTTASGIFYPYSPNQRIQRVYKEEKKNDYCQHKQDSERFMPEAGPNPWPLYNESACIKHGPTDWVLELEGEKCCDVATLLEIVACSHPGPIQKPEDKRQRYARLQGSGVAGIIYLADNDKAGKNKALTCAKAAKEACLPFVALNTADLWPFMPEGGSIDDLPAPLDRFETIATIEKAANSQWQKQNQEAGKKEKAVRKITTKPAEKAEPKRQRLAPDEVMKMLPEKMGSLRLNTRNGEIQADGAILPPNTITRLYLELSNNEQQWPKETTIDAVALLASRDSFDPVAEYLLGIQAPALPPEQWQRLDQHLLGIDDPIAAAFLPRFFISAVARTFEPGCDCRQLPVLIGPQWRGKSALGRILFGAEQWVEGIGDLGKDALLKAHTAWGVELAELDGVTRRSDQESLKAFISETADTIRKPYDRAPERFPRRFVFWGTSNGAPLRDLTGNTRYVTIPIPDRMLPLDWAAANRDALWSKAVEQYQAAVQWRDCSEQEREAITERNQEHQELDPWEEKVAFFINNHKIGCQYVQLKEVLEMLEIPIERQSNQMASRISRLIQNLGWKRERRRLTGGGQLQAFWRPAPKQDETIPIESIF